MCALSSRSARIGTNHSFFRDPKKKKSIHLALNRVAQGSLASANGATDLVTQLSGLEDRRLRKLVQMMEEEPMGNIHDWALAFNLSHSYLRHLFKKATGISLNHVLTEQRLQKAAQMLVTSNLSVKEIASAVGYEHTSSFTRAFERRFDQAPRSYRDENGWT